MISISYRGCRGTIALSAVVCALVLTGCTPRPDTEGSPASSAAAASGYGRLPDGSKISGAPSEGDLTAARSSSDEIVIDDLRGLTLERALNKLGPLASIAVPTGAPGEVFDSKPVVKGAPINQPRFADVPKAPASDLTVTAVAAIKNVVYFGVIRTADIPTVSGLAEMLAERSPVVASRSKNAPLWYSVRGDLLDQAGVTGASLEDWTLSVVRQPGGGR